MDMVKSSRVPYLQNCSFSINSEQSLAHTKFYVDHREVNELVKNEGKQWRLGIINEGDEFLAITFAFDQILT